MKLTRNEKKTLKLLLNNSRISNSEIASKLKISSVAIGKIRKKLESSLIDSYTLNLNYSKLGIKTFAITISRLTNEGLNQGESEIEQKLLKNPHITNVYRVPKGSATYIIFYGFKNMTELDNFFHSNKLKKELHKFVEIQELFAFSHNSLIKNNSSQLFNKAIDDFGNKIQKIKINGLI